MKIEKSPKSGFIFQVIMLKISRTREPLGLGVVII
jgi:hypothetical protein